MRDFYQFAGQHPFVTILLAWIVENILSWPFRLINRAIRSRNIKNSGWPPLHLDADGDAIKKES